MQDSRTGLLDGVKTTVARYGLVDFSTRKLSEISGINNGLIYHYFKNIEEVLLLAYFRENGAIFDAMVRQVEEISDIPFDFQTKTRLWFHKIWRLLLSDPDRLVFCTSFFHSLYYKAAESFNAEQMQKLLTRFGPCFRSENEARQTMYSLLTLLYDSAMRVVDGKCPDSPETEETIFSLFFAMLNSQFRQEKA